MRNCHVLEYLEIPKQKSVTLAKTNNATHISANPEDFLKLKISLVS